MKWRNLWIVAAAAVSALLAPPMWCAAEDAPPSEPTTEQIKFFETNVRPLLLARCVKCHGPDEQNGELRLDSRAGVLTGGESGPAIEPGKPQASLLVEAINYESLEMPPKGQLPKAEIDTLETWIKMGAPWPAGEAGDLSLRGAGKISDEDRAWWAFQQVQDPAVPIVEGDKWSQTDVDRFIYRRLQQEGLQPTGEADKRQLIRRLYFDLIGLPPTPEEVQAFLADDSPGAYEKLVDALLDSPRYGEKWARHWLDLVRYAESDGYKADGFRPEAWRYRDYVIRAFNDDKPYDQFVMEQLAGDEIAPGDRDAQAATMFLRHGMYEFNQRDVIGQRELILNELVDTTSDVFLGMGMSCARCHDHKFDPLLQKDYFRLQAFFAPLTWQDTVPLANVDERAKYREQLARWEAMTADFRRELDEIERPVLLAHAGGEGFTKFTPDLQAMIVKRPEDRDPLEQQLAEMASRQFTLDYEKLPQQIPGEKKDRWKELKAQLAELEKQKPQPLSQIQFAVCDVGPIAPPTFITGKERLGEIAPGFLSVLDEGGAKIEPLDESLQSTGRRTALARWIASKDNPLSTRVIVNRVWQYHFGQGLAANASDFGRLGEPPSHPELLDWLTSRFVDGGWRLKSLHRLIVTSATYQQSAAGSDAAAMNIDPANRLLWRQNIRRVEAEQIRDAVLAVTGELDEKLGGASAGAGSTRRTVYTKVVRNDRDPLLEVFDAPDALSSTAQRNTTTNAMQALLLLNSDWPLARAKKLATRLQRDAPGSAEGQIRRAYWLCFGREATSEEVAAAVEFLGRQQAIIDGVAAGVAAKDEQPRNDRKDVPLTVAKFPATDLSAVELRPSGKQPKLTVPFSDSLPDGDFTIEAFIQLDSLYADATVRTIAAHCDADTNHPGWALGVTSEKSKHTPRNLILQLTGRTASGQLKYEVLPSGIHIELKQPYYVAAVVDVEQTGDEGVTFYVQRLGEGGELQSANVKHEVVRGYRPDHALSLGGRHGTDRHYWDGLIGNVRLSSSALSAEKLLIQNTAEADVETTIGHWRFADEAENAFADSSPHKNHIARSNMSDAVKTAKTSTTALVDFCHVLLNANEFLYVD